MRHGAPEYQVKPIGRKIKLQMPTGYGLFSLCFWVSPSFLGWESRDSVQASVKNGSENDFRNYVYCLKRKTAEIYDKIVI